MTPIRPAWVRARTFAIRKACVGARDDRDGPF
jgi:hypothetical protein